VTTGTSPTFSLRVSFILPLDRGGHLRHAAVHFAVEVLDDLRPPLLRPHVGGGDLLPVLEGERVGQVGVTGWPWTRRGWRRVRTSGCRRPRGCSSCRADPSSACDLPCAVICTGLGGSSALAEGGRTREHREQQESHSDTSVGEPRANLGRKRNGDQLTRSTKRMSIPALTAMSSAAERRRSSSTRIAICQSNITASGNPARWYASERPGSRECANQRSA